MIDLHMHSRYSDDGDYTPESLAEQCAKSGIKVFSVTDHNCVRADKEAKGAAKKLGLYYLSGGEFDGVFHGINFHILGYGIDTGDSVFADLENNIVRQSASVSYEMLEKTNTMGFHVTEEEMEKVSRDCYWRERWTGEMFAEVLLGKPEYENHPLLLPYRAGGDRSDNPYVNVYWDFYSQGKPCHAAMVYPPAKEVIDMIHKAGGLAVLAHPGANLRGREEMAEEIVSLGADGIEVFSSYHSEAQEEYFLNMAKKLGKLITCGSDFHGKTKPAIHLGAAARRMKGKAGRMVLESLRQGGIL